jgi:hypothetical protein
VKKSDRPLILLIAIIIGICLGNLGWIVPTAVARGGGDFIAACVLLPLFCLLFFIVLWVGPKWPE